MKTSYVKIPSPIIPGHKIYAVVPEWPDYFDQEYEQSQREKANSRYRHGARFGYFDADNQLTDVYILVEHEQGLWSLINSQTYEPWTPPLLIGPFVSEGDLHLLTDGFSNVKPI